MAVAVTSFNRARLREAYGLLRRHWTPLQSAVDALVWLVALPVAVAFRHDFVLADVAVSDTLSFGVLGAILFLLVGWASGIYARRWNYGSFDELTALCGAALLTGTVLFVLNLLHDGQLVPRSAAISGTCLAVVGLCASRFAARQVLEGLSRPGTGAVPVVVYGAGNAGTQLVRSMRCNPNSDYRPLAFLDDSTVKTNLSVAGVRVMGRRADMAAVMEGTGAQLLVLAMPSGAGEMVRDIVAEAERIDVAVMTVPKLAELPQGIVEADDIRPVTEADLLGRGQIRTDLAAAAGYITGRCVLVTGAGGSIGSELCRQVHALGPARLVMVDRDESGLHAVQLSIDGRALLEDRNLVVADIRDRDRLDEVFAEHRPEVVFHAAALKHLPLLEMHPHEGVKTNIMGTENVLAATDRYGVDRFVNISTDKAANPTSVLGYTKRVAERLTAAAANQTGRAYLSVRFGNVLGSRGSVVPAFKTMIDAGGPVTVTHPDVTRFFMTIPEAVELVIQAGAIGAPGEVLVLDMGEPVRIVDVARRLIAASGRDIDIEYTGLRPGEKLHEVLFDDSELGLRPIHPLISHTSVAPLHADSLMEGLTGSLSGATTSPSMAVLRRLAMGSEVISL